MGLMIDKIAEGRACDFQDRNYNNSWNRKKLTEII